MESRKRRKFSPEFLNRLDDFIVFHYLERAHVLQSARILVEDLRTRMSGKTITLDIDERVIEKLARDGFNPVYGARPLRREIERQLENPLAMKIVRGECRDGEHISVGLEDGRIVFTPAERLDLPPGDLRRRQFRFSKSSNNPPRPRQLSSFLLAKNYRQCPCASLNLLDPHDHISLT